MIYETRIYLQDGELIVLDIDTINVTFIHTTIVDLSIIEYAKRHSTKACELMTKHIPYSNRLADGDIFVELAVKLLGIDRMVVKVGTDVLATIEMLSDGYVRVDRFV